MQLQSPDSCYICHAHQETPVSGSSIVTSSPSFRCAQPVSRVCPQHLVRVTPTPSHSFGLPSTHNRKIQRSLDMGSKCSTPSTANAPPFSQRSLNFNLATGVAEAIPLLSPLVLSPFSQLAVRGGSLSSCGRLVTEPRLQTGPG